MAYMRGDIYVWSNDDGIHLWNARGYDWWRESVWNEGRGEEASGVVIPQETFDELVVMRLANLMEEGMLRSTIQRALLKWPGYFEDARSAKLNDLMAKLAFPGA